MENQFFSQIRNELQKKKGAGEFRPVSAEDDLEASLEAMTLEDHVMSLRYTIHHLIAGTVDISIEDFEDENLMDEGGRGRFLKDKEMPKQLNELLSGEVYGGYEKILADFREITDQGELVDVDSNKFSGEIDGWIRQLVADIKNKRPLTPVEFDLGELEAQCWFLFEAMANVINTETLEKGVVAFYEGKDLKSLPDKEKSDLREKCIEELGKKYPLSRVELEILIDLVTAGKEGEEYSFRILMEAISRLWKEYGVGDQKKIISKIALGSLMGEAAGSFAPSLLEGVMSGGNFNLLVFLEYLGLNQVLSLSRMVSRVDAAEFARVVNTRINERITNSLFFQEFEFVQGRELGEIYSRLERGKSASQQLLTEAVSELMPMIVGIAMSLAFLTKVNPILGAIGLGGLPVMYQVAKKNNRKLWAIYEGETAGDVAIASNLGAIKRGLEEVRASSDIVAVKEHTRQLLNKKDVFTADRMVAEAKAKFKQIMPFDIAQGVAAVVGWMLQQMGKISGGAVLANTFYAERLNGPINHLVYLYFNVFSRYVQDIKNMEEVLGKYENLDLPEGEKEKERIPVRDLPNLDISVRGIDFKGILSGLNMEIKEGEFVTIVGDSGGGKSTLLRLLAGLYKPNEGQVLVGGVDLQKIKKYGQESIYSRMSYCNQSPQIFEELSLRENLILWSKTEVPDEKIIKVMRDLHLDKFIDQLDSKVKNLSGGERVRIGLARTLIKGAQLLLLDEPTASLDSRSGTEVRRLIQDIKRDYPNVTIICVTHDEELMKRSQRRLDIGVLQGRPEEEVVDEDEDF